ncbi:hypothetical protein GX50_05229 [[Emmonsia] crescens]|uniref:HNH nuclease domain-containing protein n=1 Tax=[Emmonsia] crescens TaxID=73230 RepID=A0A2B7Z6F5_9EURO|nr:hypothetical protein GX50_05229 [Emmonsia crescens]
MASEMDVDASVRPRSNTVIHRPDEIYNMPNPERMSLLAELQDAMGTVQVPAPFWACLQVCEISQLHLLVETARSSPLSVSLLSESCASIPLKWMQRIPKESSSNPSHSSNPSFRRTRLSSAVKLAQERDKFSCVLTKDIIYEVAHIYPNCLINPRRSTLLEESVPGFWRLLQFFWGPDRLSQWRAELFKDPENPTKASDGCFNVMCLRDDLHTRWTKGHFALRPVSLSEDKSKLVVELYWQPKPSHTFRDMVNIVETPASSKDLEGYQGRFLIDVEGSPVSVKSGYSFTLTTNDPETHPLPSFSLLEMQWHLTRIVAMCGAADIYDEVYTDDDDDADDLPRVAAEERPMSRTEVLNWVQSTISSSSDDNDDNNDDDNDDHDDDDKPHYSAPTSADVSPLKNRDVREDAGSEVAENLS